MFGDDGNLIFCEGDLITPSYMNYVEIHGTNGSVVGSILKHVPTFIFCKKAKGNYNKGMNQFNFPQIDLFEKELGFFLNNLNNNKKTYMNSVEDSIKITKILEKI